MNHSPAIPVVSRKLCESQVTLAIAWQHPIRYISNMLCEKHGLSPPPSEKVDSQPRSDSCGAFFMLWRMRENQALADLPKP
jgi:hypothetical protein